jgi:hypothetical protein
MSAAGTEGLSRWYEYSWCESFRIVGWTANDARWAMGAVKDADADGGVTPLMA